MNSCPPSLWVICTSAKGSNAGKREGRVGVWVMGKESGRGDDGGEPQPWVPHANRRTQQPPVPRVFGMCFSQLPRGILFVRHDVGYDKNT